MGSPFVSVLCMGGAVGSSMPEKGGRGHGSACPGMPICHPCTKLSHACSGSAAGTTYIPAWPPEDLGLPAMLVPVRPGEKSSCRGPPSLCPSCPAGQGCHQEGRAGFLPSVSSSCDLRGDIRQMIPHSGSPVSFQ